MDTETEDPDSPAEPSHEEVLAEIRSLTEADKKRLLVLAGRIWSKFRLQSRFTEPDDLLQEAIVRVLSERRTPARGVELTRFLWGVMKSVASHGLEKDVLYEKRLRDSLALNESARRSGTASQGGLPPAATSESRVAARDSLDKLDDFLTDDPNLMEVVKLKAQGWKPAEIRGELRLTERDWDTLKKRALRKITKFQRAGD